MEVEGWRLMMTGIVFFSLLPDGGETIPGSALKGRIFINAKPSQVRSGTFDDDHWL